MFNWAESGTTSASPQIFNFMARSVFMVYYGLGNSPVAVYSEAFRVVACMRVMLGSGAVSDLELFRVKRYSVAKGSEVVVISKDVTSEFKRIYKNSLVARCER